MSQATQEHAGLHDPIIRQNCRTLKTPAIAAQYQRLAAVAAREGYSHIRYLDALLGAEIEERERKAVLRRVKEARLPRLKTLQGFAAVSAARVADLASGGYIARAEPVLLIGEAGTGKTHLASGLCVAACEQRRRVRFTTATALVNELVEARAGNVLSRALGRWERIELICIDELGYVPLAELGAELLFQVIADRAERAAVIVTSNLPFSEWGQVFPNARLCQALVDRLTDRAHILETGTASYRFRRTLAASSGTV
jgi:DNA replication protein DnaC